ncbi:S phase cyclin A-associated protein in the endoplasmic reticulum-like [Asparagus officinalis]|uniref:S phase cyclin A-associated protein in the endoplasmic reticulum-like n=1 Tax=Asparagus officinalis TaxID=4686 RepID=UPI00098E25F8|nr:S phase cyclin A-associated protein in the endoplasmic reticulum-like [Asparagus officinalis]
MHVKPLPGHASYILPSNFEEVATGVLKVLNNLALLDIAFLQRMLGRPDLKMELFHLMSFLLSYCTSKWKAANDQLPFTEQVCDLPFVFFSDPELTPILASTLMAACYGCDQNRGLVLQELSVDMLLSLLKSCRQSLLADQPDNSLQENSLASDLCDGTQQTQEAKKPQGDNKPNRKGARFAFAKGSTSISNIKATKAKSQREHRGTKTCDEWAFKHNLPSSETSHTFMLHQRFPTSFLDKAEEFFTSGSLELQL